MCHGSDCKYVELYSLVCGVGLVISIKGQTVSVWNSIVKFVALDLSYLLTQHV